MAGQRQKAPEVLVNKWGGRVKPAQAVAAPVKRPPAPRGLGPEASKAWRDIWSAPVAGAWSPAELPVLLRWVRGFDDWTVLRAKVLADPLVAGSHGQPVLNPLASRVQALEANLHALEDRLGMSPLARFRLNIAAVRAEEGKSKLEAIMERRNRRPLGPPGAGWSPQGDVIEGVAVEVGQGEKHHG